MPQSFLQDQNNNPLQMNEKSAHILRSERDTAIRVASEAIRDTTRLTRLMTILNDSGPLNLMLDRGLSTLSELFLADIVVLLDPVGTGSFTPLASIGLPEDIKHLPFSDEEGGYTNLLLHHEGTILVEEAGSAQNIDMRRLRELGVETLVGLPVKGNHVVRGVLILARCRPAPFTKPDIALLKAVARRIGRILVVAQRDFQFKKLVQSGREISRHLYARVVISEAVRMFPLIVSADASALILRDQNGALVCEAQSGLNSSSSTAICRFAEQLIVSSLLENGEPFNSDDLNAALNQLSLNDLNLLPVKAMIAIPIHRKDHIQGMLFGIRFAPIAFNFGASQIAMLYAEQISAALENCSLYKAAQIELAERMRLQEEQRQWERQQQQLKKANSLNSMAGAIAHHFNNQLCVVMGNLELALSGLQRGECPDKLLTAAMQGALKAAEVSNSMLTYLGQTTCKHVPLDLAEICRQSLPLLRATAPKDLLLRTDLSSSGLIINANANQIQQVVNNLVTNAWEASDTAQGVIDLAIKRIPCSDISPVHRFPVDWQPQGSAYACVEIKDAGCGIAEEDIEKIFDPFFSSKFTGRGLGLSLVLGIAKAHGGVVTVESEKGQGCTFRFILPLSAEEIPHPLDKTFTPAVIQESRAVLLVEDEEMVRDTAITMLAHLGFKVFVAKDGIEAMEKFQHHRDEINVVLCDLSMPRMNGWETLSALRRINADIPVVLTSGHDESMVTTNDHPEILPAFFLHKPYRKGELMNALVAAMKGS